MRKTPSPALARAKARPRPKTRKQPQIPDGSSKLDRMVSALRSTKGATVPHLMAITGWQSHSVRGAIAGALKKKRGLNIVSAKTSAERIYRIEVRR